MGLKITTDDKPVKVFRSDRFQYPQYSIALSQKVDNEWVSIYKQVRFRRGIELANGEMIRIHDAFPTLDTWRDKSTNELKSKEVWMIMDFSYDTVPKQEPAPARSTATDTLEHYRNDGVQATLDDLPDNFQAAEDDIPFKP